MHTVAGVKPPLVTYGLTVAAVLVAWIVRWLLDPALGDHVPYPTFFIAVAFAAWLGGLRPAALATVLGFFIALYFFVPPRWTLTGATWPHLLGLGMYLLVCSVIAGFGEAMRVSLRQFEEIVAQQKSPAALSLERIEHIREHHGLREGVLVGFALTFAVLLVGCIVGYVNLARLINNQSQIAHEYEVVADLELLLSLLKDAETGQRGFLLTEKIEYLEPYHESLAEIRQVRGRLQALTSSNAELQATLAAIDTDIEVRLGELQRTIGLLQAGDRAAAMVIVQSDIGKSMMDDLRKQISAIRQVEVNLLAKRTADSRINSATALVSNAITSAIGIFLLGLVFYLNQRNLVARQRAAEAYAEQGERLRTTLASIGDAVIATDKAGLVTMMNTVAQDLTGWSAVEATGQPLDVVFKIVNESTRKPVENPAFRALREGVIVGLANHTVLIARNGLERAIDDSAAPIRCGDGEVVGCVLIFRDITDRVSAETTLMESEARYRAIGESIDFGIWMCDAEGRNTYASPSFLRMVGITQEQCSNYGWGELLHPEDSSNTIEAWKQCVKEGSVWDREHRFKGVDGTWHDVLARGVPVKNELGVVLGWAGINLDISRLKQAEAALIEADHRKNEFLATLAHELRNPLAPVRNAVQILQMTGPENPELQWARDVIDRQMQVMARLIDDLMDLSRVSRNKLDLVKERVELAVAIQGAIETSRPLIEEQGHEFVVALPSETLVIEADLTRLAQIFLNLLNNAAKYTEPGGRITLTAEQQGGDVFVSVKDTGIGIPSANLATIFEMFSQVEGSLSRSQGGLGIGLCLVRRLVEMHGGSIEALSDGPGKGSEFIVRLPVVAESLSTVNPPRNVPGTSPTLSLRILVVDDNRDAAASLAMLLRLMGNSIRTAHDGEEAVRAAHEFQPHVVILDIGLPKVNGYDAARAIRALKTGADMVLIAVTGWGQDEDKRKAQAAGFDRHMVKPVDPQELISILTQLSMHDDASGKT